MALTTPLPAGRAPTLAERLGKIADVVLTLETIAADERRSHAVTEQVLDQAVAAGEALVRLGRGRHARPAG